MFRGSMRRPPHSNDSHASQTASGHQGIHAPSAFRRPFTAAPRTRLARNIPPGQHLYCGIIHVLAMRRHRRPAKHLARRGDLMNDLAIVGLEWLGGLALFLGFILLLRYLEHRERMSLIERGLLPTGERAAHPHSTRGGAVLR